LNQEKKFLHDIASPLTTIHLNLENVIYLLEEKKVEGILDCIRILNSCVVQTKRAMDLVHDHREILIKSESK